MARILLERSKIDRSIHGQDYGEQAPNGGNVTDQWREGWVVVVLASFSAAARVLIERGFSATPLLLDVVRAEGTSLLPISREPAAEGESLGGSPPRV